MVDKMIGLKTDEKWQDQFTSSYQTTLTCYGGTESDAGMCGDCWHSSMSNKVCLSLFYFFLCVLVFNATLMVLYHIYRKRANVEVASKAFYTCFIFITFWEIARIAYLSDSYFNYSYKQQAVLAVLPCFMAFLTIIIAIYNV